MLEFEIRGQSLGTEKFTAADLLVPALKANVPLIKQVFDLENARTILR
jgi:hypothetical protein